MVDQLLRGSIIQKRSADHPVPTPIIDFQIHLALARTGLRSVRAPLCTVTWSQIRGRYDDDEHDGPSEVSLAQAVAKELNITVEEAGELETASDDGSNR